MRQLAGTKTRYRRAHAAPLAALISDRAEYKAFYRLPFWPGGELIAGIGGLMTFAGDVVTDVAI